MYISKFESLKKRSANEIRWSFQRICDVKIYQKIELKLRISCTIKLNGVYCLWLNEIGYLNW